ncbi:transcriptional regulator [Natronorubrum sediminis]|nr:transcriptional regulator [Natronorubrum sediminis]
MNEVDDAILEFLRDLEVDGQRVALKPGAVHHNLVEEFGMLDKSLSTFSRRMDTLAGAGLLEKSKDGKGSPYKITDKGISYLDGELHTEDLRSN